jgi:hypothetical protein
MAVHERFAKIRGEWIMPPGTAEVIATVSTSTKPRRSFLTPELSG